MELLAFGIMRDIHCHADAEDLERYSMGASSPEEIAPIEEHLLICEDCRNRLRETDSFLNSIQMSARQWRRDERAAKGRGWKIPAWFPVLAAACGLVLVGEGQQVVGRVDHRLAELGAEGVRDAGGQHAPVQRSAPYGRAVRRSQFPCPPSAALAPEMSVPPAGSSGCSRT